MSDNDLYGGSILSRWAGRLAFVVLLVAVVAAVDGQWTVAPIAFLLFLLLSHLGYKASGGARNPALYQGVPPVPDIRDEPSVVDWFLQYDRKLEDVRRRFPDLLPSLRQHVLADLRAYPDAHSLNRHVQSLSEWYSRELAPQFAATLRDAESLDETRRSDAERVIRTEALLGCGSWGTSC